jgi:hypothetical protein
MVDGEQIYGDEVQRRGRENTTAFFQCTAIQKRLLAKPQA